jgi:acylglycerol lipase
MLSISPETRPPYIVELVAKAIRAIAPRLQLAEANKGLNSEDPTIEVQFQHNPQTYHGKLRVATGLAILAGLEDVARRFRELDLPFLAVHGTGDRVTDHKATILLHEVAPSKDKTLKLFPGYEHILLRRHVA